MLENIQGDSWGSILPLRMPSLLPHDLCHEWNVSRRLPAGCHFLLQCMKVKSEVKSLSRVQLFMIPWTTTYQTPPSMGFSRQEYWSGVPLPSPISGSSSGLFHWSFGNTLSIHTGLFFMRSLESTYLWNNPLLFIGVHEMHRLISRKKKYTIKPSIQ